MNKIEYGYIKTYHGKLVFCFPPNWMIGQIGECLEQKHVTQSVSQNRNMEKRL